MTDIDTILLDRDGTLIEERHYLRDPDGVARAALLVLAHPDHVPEIGECGADLVALVAEDKVDAFGPERSRRIEHMREHRSARERQQYLGLLRLHALAFAGGEDDHVQWPGFHCGVHQQ